MKRLIAASMIACGLACSTGCMTPAGGNPFWPLPGAGGWQKQQVPQATIPKVRQGVTQPPTQPPPSSQQNKPGGSAFSTTISD